MPGVFISYRRDDTKGFAGALLRDLNQRIGTDQVFMDVEDIVGGTHFPSVLEAAVNSSPVVLVLIGPRWLDFKDAAGQARLQDPKDFVRLEIQLALQRGARVIPVLVDGARVPTSESLPEPLRPLAALNALELSNNHWEEDVARLADHIREGMYAVGTQQAAGAKLAADFDPTPPMSRNVKVVVSAAIGIGLLAVVGGLAMAFAQTRSEQHALRAEGVVLELLREAAAATSGSPSQGSQVVINAGQASWLYRPVVGFTTVQGQRISFQSPIATQPPAYEVGDQVPVLYDPNEPGQAQIDSFAQRFLPSVISAGLGLLLLLIGLTPLFLGAIGRMQVRRLLREGRPIVAAFHGVEEKKNITVQDRHPFVVIAEWRNPVSQELVLFRSRQVWDDPTERARRRMITVVVDPNNFRRYIMDLSFLKQGAAPPPAKAL